MIMISDHHDDHQMIKNDNDMMIMIFRLIPAGTWRKNDVKTTLWHHFDVIMTLLLRRMSAGMIIIPTFSFIFIHLFILVFLF